MDRGDLLNLDATTADNPESDKSREKKLGLIVLALLFIIVFWNSFWFLTKFLLFFIIVYVIYEISKALF
ncbi:MAG: hypothetical protein ACXQT4_06910 [Methanotrichaceae archaeon]